MQDYLLGRVRLSCQDILRIEDSTNMVVCLSGHIGKKCGYGVATRNISRAELTIYLCQALEGEVNNGGFSQFFFNSSGDYASETVEALREIGALKTAVILQKANSVYPNGLVPKDRDEREQYLLDNEEVGKALSEADDAFYGCEENLAELSYTYVMNNRGQFR